LSWKGSWPPFPLNWPLNASGIQTCPGLDPKDRIMTFGPFHHGCTHGNSIVPSMVASITCARAMETATMPTQTFTMEFLIRAFLNRWPNRRPAQLRYGGDDNYMSAAL